MTRHLPVWITCMHDDYTLHCPVCGHASWSNDNEGYLQCEYCSAEITLEQDPVNCCITVGVQGS